MKEEIIKKVKLKVYNSMYTFNFLYDDFNRMQQNIC